MTQHSKPVRSPRRLPSVEALEGRQLLTAVIDLRLPDGSKSATVGKVGDVVNIDVWAVVTGTNSTGSDDGFQDLFASFTSTKVASGSVKGDLAAANVAPFNDPGTASAGSRVDLNGDGSFDVGDADPLGNGYFFARAHDMQTTGGVVGGASHSFKVGTLTYTVSSPALGLETDVNCVLRNSRFSAVWEEDGVNRAVVNGGVLSVGKPVRITGPTPTPPPTGGISGTVYKDLNGDGIKQSGETGFAGVTVYIDANKNSVKDAGEKSVVTGSAGTYSFTGLAAGTYRVAEVVPTTAKAVSPGTGHLDVTLASGVNVSGKNFFDQPKAAVVVTIDNSKAMKTGTWTSLTSPSGFFGTNYLSDGGSGKGTKSVTFKSALPSSGTYLVYARWVGGTDRSSAVPVDVTSKSGTSHLTINEQTNGSQWVLLGTYTFDATTGATVTIRNANTKGLVIADAIELVKVI